MNYIQVQPLGTQEKKKDLHYAVKKSKKYTDLEKKYTRGVIYSSA